MYICTYMYTYTRHIHVKMHVCMHAFHCAYICTYVYTYVCLYAWMYASMFVCMYVYCMCCVFVCVYWCMWVSKCTYVWKYTCIHITCMNTYLRVSYASVWEQSMLNASYLHKCTALTHTTCVYIYAQRLRAPCSRAQVRCSARARGHHVVNDRTAASRPAHLVLSFWFWKNILVLRAHDNAFYYQYHNSFSCVWNDLFAWVSTLVTELIHLCCWWPRIALVK